MAGDTAELVNEMWPYVAAAISGYGTAVLRKSEDAAADVTLGWGRRLIQRVFGTGEAPEAVIDLADDPEDTDLQAALRVQLRKMLASDQCLAAEVRVMLAEVPSDSRFRGAVSNAVVGSEVGGDNIQIGSAGGDVRIRRG